MFRKLMCSLPLLFLISNSFAQNSVICPAPDQLTLVGKNQWTTLTHYAPYWEAAFDSAPLENRITGFDHVELVQYDEDSHIYADCYYNSEHNSVGPLEIRISSVTEDYPDFWAKATPSLLKDAVTSDLECKDSIDKCSFEIQ